MVVQRTGGWHSEPVVGRGHAQDAAGTADSAAHVHCTLGDCAWSSAEGEEGFGEVEVFLGFGGRG